MDKGIKRPQNGIRAKQIFDFLSYEDRIKQDPPVGVMTIPDCNSFEDMDLREEELTKIVIPCEVLDILDEHFALINDYEMLPEVGYTGNVVQFLEKFWRTLGLKCLQDVLHKREISRSVVISKEEALGSVCVPSTSAACFNESTDSDSRPDFNFAKELLQLEKKLSETFEILKWINGSFNVALNAGLVLYRNEYLQHLQIEQGWRHLQWDGDYPSSELSGPINDLYAANEDWAKVPFKDEEATPTVAATKASFPLFACNDPNDEACWTYATCLVLWCLDTWRIVEDEEYEKCISGENKKPLPSMIYSVSHLLRYFVKFDEINSQLEQNWPTKSENRSWKDAATRTLINQMIVMITEEYEIKKIDHTEKMQKLAQANATLEMCFERLKLETVKTTTDVSQKVEGVKEVPIKLVTKSKDNQEMTKPRSRQQVKLEPRTRQQVKTQLGIWQTVKTQPRSCQKMKIKREPESSQKIKIKREPESCQKIKIKREPESCQKIKIKREPESCPKKEPGKWRKVKKETGSCQKIKIKREPESCPKKEPGKGRKVKKETRCLQKIKVEPGICPSIKTEPGICPNIKTEPGTCPTLKTEPGICPKVKAQPRKKAQPRSRQQKVKLEPDVDLVKVEPYTTKAGRTVKPPKRLQY